MSFRTLSRRASRPRIGVPGPAAVTLAAVTLAALSQGPAGAAGDDITAATVKDIDAGGHVAAARIPDGVYLRRINDPDDTVWDRLPEYRMTLNPAPPVHESVALRHDPDAPGRDVFFTVARTSDRFYVRLRWHDASRDTATTLDRFRDGAAVQFSLGDAGTSAIMGTGPAAPVNIWYWRADDDSVQSLGAGGPGSTTRLDDQPVSGASQYRATRQWVVVMSRPLAATGPHQVSFDRAELPIAFAVWQGADGERDGLKRVSDDWIIVDLQ